jgi:hypothetical protein
MAEESRNARTTGGSSSARAAEVARPALTSRTKIETRVRAMRFIVVLPRMSGGRNG